MISNEVCDILASGVYLLEGVFVGDHKLLLVSVAKLVVFIFSQYLPSYEDSVFCLSLLFLYNSVSFVHLLFSLSNLLQNPRMVFSGLFFILDLLEC